MYSKKIGILLISDLHFSDKFFDDGKESIIQSEKSFTTNLTQYIKSNEKKENFKCKYLVLAGDASNAGHENEFNDASTFLEKICEDIGIDKKNVLIIPGNHDYNRGKFMTFIESNLPNHSSINLTDYNDVKFSDYKKFYDTFFKDYKDNKFDGKKIITDTMLVTECDMLFIGINSAYKDSFRTGDQKEGYIDIDCLDKELSLIDKKHPSSKIVAVMHHPGDYSNLGKIENWHDAKVIFDKYGITTFISGDVHTSESTAINKSQSLSEGITCGTLGKVGADVDNTFIMLISEDDPITEFKVQLHKYENHDFNLNNRYWQYQSDCPNMISSIKIIQKKGAAGLKSTIECINANTESPLDTYTPPESNLVLLQDLGAEGITDEGRKFFIRTISDNKLYVTGHFHWSKEGKSLTYLMTDYFYEDSNNLERLTIAVKNIVSQKRINPDLIIGYEMNGSIIGSLIATDMRVAFTYLTGSFRDYTQRESDLPNGSYKNILVIVDFLYTNSLIPILEKKISEAYPDLKKITICTIFYGTVNKKPKTNSSKLLYVFNVPMLKCNQNIKDCPIHKNCWTEITELYVSK